MVSFTALVNEKPIRATPYIVRIGSTCQVVVDCVPFIEAQSTTEAIASLMACYFVFHMHYSSEVQASLLFLQHEILRQPDSTTEGCNTLSIFLNHLKRA